MTALRLFTFTVATVLATGLAGAQAPAPPSEPAPAAQPLPPMQPAPAVAPAPAPPAPREVQSGFSIGLREGLAFPGGSMTKGDSLSDSVVTAVPGQFDIGVRLPFGLGLGGYFGFALGIPDCDVDVTCTAMGVRLGLQADWRFNQQGRAMPWVGVLAGVEMLYLSAEYLGITDELSFMGTELGLQGGVDFRLGRKFALGPYAQLTFGTFDEYTRVFDDVTVGDGSIPSDARARHSWFTLGVKATLTL